MSTDCRRSMPVTRTSGQGRKKRIAVNKFNASIKDLVLGALEDVGGREYLAARALDQPVAFMGLIGRILPLQVTGENGGATQPDVVRMPTPIESVEQWLEVYAPDTERLEE